MTEPPAPTQDSPEIRRLNAGIVGGGRGCETILRMVAADRLGRFRMRIMGVADTNPEAIGLAHAREVGVPLITSDFREILEIPDLDLIIELTGSVEVRDELERTRPRHIRLIDHFGASLFWELYTAEEAIIQHRTELRERVEEERQWISQIFDSIPDEILVLDPNMVVKDANASFLRNNNFSDVSEVRGRQCYDLEQAVRGECHVAEGDCPTMSALRGGKPTSTLRKHFDRTGKPRFATLVSAPLLDAKGEVAGVIECTRDITALKQAEQELNRTRDQLNNVANHSPLTIVTMDMRGDIIGWNPGAADAMGYEAAEVMGRSIGIILPKLDERRQLQHRITNEGAVRDYEGELVRKDGTAMPVNMTLSQLRDIDGEMVGTVAIAKDISGRQLLMNQVMQSERMAAVGRLAAGVAHEINNPLAVMGEIAGYLSELIDEDKDIALTETREELTQGLPKIIKHVKRCRGITYRLLNFARKSAGRVEFTDVNAALDEIIPFVNKELELSRVQVHKDYDLKLPKVQMEELQLQEIFINLINNAIQAVSSDGSGRIWLETRLDQGKATVCVRDNGPGIAPEIMPKLFDPFVTSKAPDQGTGLGLSICYAIVKRYDGSITVQSAPGEGATFTVQLPIKRATGELSITEGGLPLEHPSTRDLSE